MAENIFAQIEADEQPNVFAQIEAEPAEETNVFAQIEAESAKPKTNIFDQFDVQSDIGKPIDVTRPILTNADKTFSTEQTITIDVGEGENVKYVNIPTIVDGKKRPDNEAIDLYYSGKNKSVGDFNTVEEAVSAAQKRSQKIGEVRGPEAENIFAQIEAEPATPSLPDSIADYALGAVKAAVGVPEAVVGMGTGIAATVTSGLAGAGAALLNWGGYDVDAGRIVQKVGEALTYSPRTDAGQKVLSTIAIPFEWWREIAAEPLGEKTIETTDSPLLATAVYTATDFIPWLLLPKGAQVAGKGIKASAKGITQAAKATAEVTAKVAKAAKIDKAKLRYIVDPVKSVIQPVKEAFAPISTGSKEAMIAAKTYANNIRMTDTLRNEIIQNVEKNFTKKEMAAMADANIAEELASSRGVAAEGGFKTLPVKQQEAISILMERHKPVVDEAISLGILKAHKENYFPRKTIEVLDSESVARIEQASGMRLTTSTKHAKARKYETAEETAAAASEALGKEMKVLNDIRVLPLVTAELQKAIAGKTLINEIKAQSKIMGVDSVINGEKPGYFTIDHPAMKEWKPKLEKQPNGKYRVVNDENGNPIFEKHQLAIHESFKGPLEAVLKNESGKIANAFMTLKAKSMSLIMFNPLMHGMVIWGKALPFQPWRTLTFKNYRDGRRMYNGPEMEYWVTHSTQHGMAPIGNQGWMQRMNDIMQTPQLSAGKSWTAKITGQLARPFGKQEAAMGLIDKAGHVWHDTFLWEPIRHAQMGMYKNLYESFLKDGMTEEAAGYTAGHMANRFAGSIPFEDMGHGFRATTNFMLFSRTFNATNAGIYKDAIKGLPTAVQEQILKTGSALDLKVANNKLKMAARATLAKDITAMYVMNSMFQNAVEYWKTGDAGAIAQQYADNLDIYKDKVGENPLNAVLDFKELTAQSINEPGKEHRIYLGQDPYGAGTYIRNPIGKIGEDLEKLVTSPLAMATDKLSPTMKFIMGVATNDKSINKGYGIDVYNKKGSLKDAPENMGKILLYFAESHTPYAFIESTIDAIKGEDPTGIQIKKTAGQLAGFAISKGSPGGPTQGFMYDTLEKRKQLIRENMPEIIKQFRLGNSQKATQIMVDKAGMSSSEINATIRKIHPTFDKKTLNKFMLVAEPYERLKAERMIKKYYGSK